ncbi:class I SAM-dependent methyltransferase [Streptomyces platensis]|uniref:class I SAM-dependent methyltransferase n=1 Tax=Streptomyces platensis TaxID=58346 RepID=UPI003C2CAA00
MASGPQAFASAAAYYARYRPHYPDALFSLLADRFPLADTRALDLGCGPGTVALPLAELTGEVLAVEMLDQGRHLAAERRVRNIRWIQGDAADLPAYGLVPAVSHGAV